MIKHPAKYSDSIIKVLDGILPNDGDILDCFAGTGKIKQIRPKATLLEIEPEWAEIRGAIVGDATQMPFEDESFDVVCTSPTYGNRMADSFVDRQPEKKYVRNTYTHCLGRKLSANNSGAMQWGEAYKDLHVKAWAECWRVLKPNGMLVLNISDHVRNGKIIPVSDWHARILKEKGFILQKHIKVETPRNRFGANSKARVSHENVFVFTKNETNDNNRPEQKDEK